MAFPSGTHELGPDEARLTVRTGKSGAASAAGHNLLLAVTAWKATLLIAEDVPSSSLELSADAGSLRVIEGTGGVQALSDEDKANIQQSIDDDVLKRESIAFSSSSVREAGPGRLQIDGQLTIVGTAKPFAFELTIDGDGKLAATATVTQSDWGMKQYSILFGALKVNDEVVVELEGQL